jgi:hypothetical protein
MLGLLTVIIGTGVGPPSALVTFVFLAAVVFGWAGRSASSAEHGSTLTTTMRLLRVNVD